MGCVLSNAGGALRMKRAFAIFLICCIMMSPVVLAEEEMRIHMFKGALLAKGYTPEQADEIMIKSQNGEDLTPFHTIEYDMYNSPAEENGLGHDLVRISGSISEYFQTDNLFGIRLTQEDGNEWIVLYAIKVDGILVGTNPFGGKDATVFDGYDDRAVEIYGEYLGYSERFHLPVVQIAGYGGMLVLDDNILIITMNSRLEMESRNIDGFSYKLYDLGYLIGAKKTIESTEKYVYWAW